MVIRAGLLGTEPVNANLGLKVNRIIMLFTAYVLCSLRLFRLDQKANNKK